MRRAALLSATIGALALAPAADAAERPLRDYNWQKRVAKAERWAEQRAGSISFSVRAPGLRRSRNGLRVYHSASIVKPMLQATYLRQRRDRELSGSERDLLRPMIRRSHDPSASRVRDIVGNPALARLADRIGMKRFATDPNWGATRVCSRDMGLLIWRMRRLLPRRHRPFAMGNLRRIVPRQRWGIPEATGWTPYFKGGWYDYGLAWRTHQIALLREPRGGTGKRRELALAILTNGQPSRGYARNTVRGVARRLVGPIAR